MPEKPSAEELKKRILADVADYHALAFAPQAFVPGKSAVPVSGRTFDATDLQLLVESGLDFWLTTGRFNKAFEHELAAWLGTRRLLTVNSGSSANLLAFAALTSPLLHHRALQPGD